MKVELVSYTNPIGKFDHMTPDEFIVSIARVSNPKNQFNTETSERLLNYCMKNGHWSIFETINVTFEVETSRAILAQMVRHKSANFQVFSNRYSDQNDIEADFFQPIELRKQGKTNRQVGDEIFNPFMKMYVSLETDVIKSWDYDTTRDKWEFYSPDEINIEGNAQDIIKECFNIIEQVYDGLVEKEVAKESARLILPQSQTTRLYMTTNVRNWVFYLKQRMSNHAQKEHRDIANEIYIALSELLPLTMKAANEYVFGG